MRELFKNLFTNHQEVVPSKDLLALDAIRERNEARISQIRIEMGELYILHPTHKKSRLDEPRPV